MDEQDRPASPHPHRRAHGLAVRVGLAIGLLSTVLGLVALALGIAFDSMLSDRAAIWFAVAALSLGLTALATRP